MEEILCSRCGTAIDVGHYDGQFFPCPSCHGPLKIDCFPAFVRPVDSAPHDGEEPIADEATCFYHPGKKAEVACEYCGRFLCGLCDMDLGGRHLCPNCLQSGKKKGRLADLENERMRYDLVAFKLALFPLIMFWFTLLTAPAALYLSIRHWKAPTSIVSPKSARVRMIAAMAISGIQVVLWAFGTVYFVSEFKR